MNVKFIQLKKNCFYMVVQLYCNVLKEYGIKKIR